MDGSSADDWVAFDTSVDYTSQLAAASAYVDPEVRIAEAFDSFADLLAKGLTLYFGDTRSANGCGLYPPHLAMSLDDRADRLADLLNGSPAYGNVEPPRRMTLNGPEHTHSLLPRSRFRAC